MIYSLPSVFSKIKDRLLLGMVETILSSKFQVDKDVSFDTMNSKMRALATINKEITTESVVVTINATAKSVSS